MAANLAAAEYRLAAYVRRADRMDNSAAFGIKSSTEIPQQCSIAMLSSACCRTTLAPGRYRTKSHCAMANNTFSWPSDTVTAGR